MSNKQRTSNFIASVFYVRIRLYALFISNKKLLFFLLVIIWVNKNILSIIIGRKLSTLVILEMEPFKNKLIKLILVLQSWPQNHLCFLTDNILLRVLVGVVMTWLLGRLESLGSMEQIQYISSVDFQIRGLVKCKIE